jgi:hypothetical protein
MRIEAVESDKMEERAKTINVRTSTTGGNECNYLSVEEQMSP